MKQKGKSEKLGRGSVPDRKSDVGRYRRKGQKMVTATGGNTGFWVGMMS